MAIKASLNTIQDFLAQHRIAMIGVSRQPKEFSAMLFEEFCRRGYDMVPVNPNAPEVLGRRCFSRIQEVNPVVDAVLLMTPASATDAALQDCADAGVRRVWIYRAAGRGSVTASALEFCREHRIEVVPGDCPWMYLPHPGVLHGAHGFIRKITGRYPTRISA